MKIRTFTARSLPEALGQVRAVLGDDAVILATQEDGRRGVTVTAAIEDQPMEELGLETAAPHAAELQAIRAALDFHRVPPGLAERLNARAAELAAGSGAATLAAALDVELGFCEPSGLAAGRPLMLVGPPGGGKTASAAKLCARAKIDGRRPALVTMDAGKSGGLAQAETFAAALEIELRAAADPAALAAALAGWEGCDPVLIDTPGANPFAPEDLQRLRLAAEAARAEMVLVLPAGGDALDNAEMAIAFAEVGVRGLIVTKLDVSRRLGGLVGAAHVSGLALIAAGLSATIGNGLTPLNPVSLARLLTAEQAPTEPFLRATGTS